MNQLFMILGFNLALASSVILQPLIDEITPLFEPLAETLFVLTLPSNDDGIAAAKIAQNTLERYQPGGELGVPFIGYTSSIAYLSDLPPGTKAEGAIIWEHRFVYPVYLGAKLKGQIEAVTLTDRAWHAYYYENEEEYADAEPLSQIIPLSKSLGMRNNDAGKWKIITIRGTVWYSPTFRKDLPIKFLGYHRGPELILVPLYNYSESDYGISFRAGSQLSASSVVSDIIRAARVFESSRVTSPRPSMP